MLVSILSAVRNEALYVSDMIESCRVQTHADWELLFVDDGSTDETLSIIRSFEALDGRIRLVGTQHARGKVSAYNTAFRNSSGEIVILLGGDDRLPPNSLNARVATMQPLYPRVSNVLGLFKIVTFSDDPKFHGMVLPRGQAGSRSGGSLTMSRELAVDVFPIPEHLISEDIWLGEATRALAQETIVSDEIILEYRIHAGNSNPRQQTYHAMSESYHLRAQGYRAVLDSPLPLSMGQRRKLDARCRAEAYRYEGRPISVLFTPNLALLDRLAVASHASPTLYWLRSNGYRWLSGWRRR